MSDPALQPVGDADGKSLEDFQRLVDNAPFGIARTRVDGQWAMVNQAFATLLGYDDPDQLIREVPTATSAWSDPAQRVALLERLGRQGHVSIDAFPWKRRDGTDILLNLSVWLIRDTQGDPAWVEAFVRDVTVERAHEDHLDTLAFAFDRIADAVLVMDPNLVVLYANRAAERLHGKSVDEQVGSTISEVSNYRWPEGGSEEAVAGALLGFGTWEGEAFVQRPDGSERLVRASSVLIRDDDGEISHLVSVSHDITESRQAEDELRHQAQLLDNVNDAIISVDRDLILTSWNRAAEETYGWSAGEVLGRPVHEVLRSELVEEEDETDELLALAETGRTRGAVIQHHRSGMPRYIEVKGMPMLDPADGSIVGYVMVNRDITERRRAEEIAREAAAAEQTAAQSNQAKSAFLSRMSHELRTPLNAILGFSQLLEMEDLTERQHTSVEHIEQGGRHLLALIDEVLDISRMDVDRLGLAVAPVRLSTLIDEAMVLVGFLADERHIEVIGADLRMWDRTVLADPQRLKQVLVNLVSNAIKYNRAGGRVYIDGVERPADDDEPAILTLSVRDTGMGIAPEDLERVFDPFERLGAETTDVEGTGLGLALSRRIVEAMGGRLWAESDGESGATFAMTLELADPSARSRDGSDADADADLGEPAAAGVETTGKILYVEDNLSNLRLVERIMSHRPGVQLLSAMQGQIGLEIARRHQPDLILLDVHLPDVPGDELLRRLRADHVTARIPVVAISADATASQVARMTEAGADEYLTKPIDVPRLLTLIDRALPSSALEA